MYTLEGTDIATFLRIKNYRGHGIALFKVDGLFGTRVLFVCGRDLRNGRTMQLDLGEDLLLSPDLLFETAKDAIAAGCKEVDKIIEGSVENKVELPESWQKMFAIEAT